MGQEASQPLPDDVPSRTLEKRDIASLAKYIKSKNPKIVVMTGAGISTSAGIPDFRSPTTGLYANLARLNLPYAEAVFDIEYFREHPEPFYTLARELYPGKFRPTITHSFIRLLSDKGLLLKLFTQNIDCLERAAGVPDEKIVEAHGSFARQSCIDCHSAYPEDKMYAHVRRGEVPRCEAQQCGGLVKPDIVFFKEPLPDTFAQNRAVPAMADLCIVMGTSLSVMPFSVLPGFCAEDTPRLLINKERVPGLGSRRDDVLLIDDCDEGVRRLARELGWLEELEALWAKTHDKTQEDGKKASAKENVTEKTKDQILEDEVDKLTKEVEATLKVSSDHESRTKDQLAQIEKPVSSEKEQAERRVETPTVEKSDGVLKESLVNGSVHNSKDSAEVLNDEEEWEEVVHEPPGGIL